MMLRVWTLILMVTIPQVVQADTALYLRQPSLSPDNQSIAFSYRGDIWRVSTLGGLATRLTSNPGRDQRPVWSPTGDQIAFASDREGQSDVYIMPSSGGAPSRLTYQTGHDYPCDWSPDGAHILTESYTGWRPDLVEYPVAGGPARPVTGVPMEGEYFARYSADGSSVVLCDGGGYVRWWREGSKTARAGQVWTLKHGSWPPEMNRISTEEIQFLWPGYSRGQIVATSNASGKANIVRLDTATGETIPITHFLDAGVRWLRVSNDGSSAVFERKFRLWHIDFDTDSVREVIVSAPSDWVTPPRVEASIAGKIEEYSLAPDGRRIAFVAGGEIYLIPSEDPEVAKRLTHSDSRERYATFAPDGKNLVYISDRNGRQNIWSVDTKSGEETELTTFRDIDASRPQYNPDGSQIAFYLSNDRIASISPDGGKVDTILLGRYFDFPLESTLEFRFSPDGKYIAYTAYGSDYNTDVWIYALDGSVNENMTRWSNYNYDPGWSPDGKYLTFIHSHREVADLLTLRLKRMPPEFAESKLDSLYDEPSKDDKDVEDDGLPGVEIDFERAHLRWRPVLNMAARQGQLVATPDGKYWLFVAYMESGANIWRVAVESDSDDKPMQLTSGSSGKSKLAVSPDSKTVYFLQDGKIGRVGIDGKKQKLLSFDSDYDYRTAERHKQKLGEVWRMLGNFFYDPDYHGASWDSLYLEYASVLPHIALDQELTELIRQFLGELNASHMNITGGTSSLPSFSAMGYLGVEFDPRSLGQGVYRVDRVMEGGPVDQSGTPVQVGDTLIAVAGRELTPQSLLDTILVGTIGRRLNLVFKGSADLKHVTVRPVSKSRNNTLRYEDWAFTRRQFVDSVSNGRLGYLHVRAMNQPALDRFTRELADQTSSYEGLIIDVRYNGGGWIAVHLLDMLERQPYVLRNFRAANTVSENKSRSYAVEKPMILLINHFSASNSEIFAEGWRELKMGKIVGYPTSAAVIGTSSYRLIDGAVCRRPSWGAFTLDMEDLEGNPRRPDIHIFNTQSDWISGGDPQLLRAIEEMITDLR